MPTYLVETYLARTNLRDRSARERRARATANELRRHQTDLRFVRSIHVPEDELCFYVFEACSSIDVAWAAERAGLEPLRIVTAVASDEDGARPRSSGVRRPAPDRKRGRGRAGPQVESRTQASRA
jgi:hypothetical protein